MPRHGNGVTDCTFSPDGLYVVSASYDGTVRIWERGGDQKAILEGHGEPVMACAVSPDGSYVVSAGWDKTARLWEPDGRARSVLRGHEEMVFDCAVSPDGSYILSRGFEQILTPRQERRRKGFEETLRTWHPDGRAWALMREQSSVSVISPDSSYIASAGEDCTVRVWDPGGRERSVLSHATDCWTACAVSPDSSYIVSGSNDGMLMISDPDGHELHTWQGHHHGFITVCRVSPDGSYIVSGSTDGEIRIWEPNGGKRAVLRGGDEELVCEVSPDGRYVVSSSRCSRRDRTLRVWEVWDVERGDAAVEIALPGDPTCLDLHPSEPLAVCGLDDGSVKIVELATLEYGPLVVSAREHDGAALRVICPACREECMVDGGTLGGVIECSSRGCGRLLRVNPFVLGQAPAAANSSAWVRGWRWLTRER